MKSIQTKFVILILGCLFISSGVIGGAGIMQANRAAGKESSKTMNLICAERAQEINGLLSRIQQSVNTVAVYVSSQLESVQRLKSDPEYLQQYTKLLETVAVNAARNTEGAMAVYVRFNPEFTPPTSGLFWSKTLYDGNFRQQTPTDFSGFNPEDTERVGWYYIPVKNGKATWIEPYLNKNVNVRMISFVIPIYMANQTVGVVGMDIDLSVLTDIVDNMQIYTGGYAFLADTSAMIVHHKRIKNPRNIGDLDISMRPLVGELHSGTSASALFSYVLEGEEKLMAFRPLTNNMRLVVTAPRAEIDAEKNMLIKQICIAVGIISILALVLTIWITRRLIRPLRELNEAAKKIAAGDMSVNLTPQTRDEVGMLTESFQKTVVHLQEYLSYINGLAYRDSLTGVKNKTAYHEVESRLEEQMRLGRPEFALVVLDINGLKYINDTYGHDFGDMLIINCSRIICRTFLHSPVFRIGGDEFVVVLENTDYKEYPQLLEKLQTNIDLHNESARADTQISIARGIAIHSSESDLVLANIFKRADDAMYQNKAAMKAKEKCKATEESKASEASD